jgi:hypothetical protein
VRARLKDVSLPCHTHTHTHAHAHAQPQQCGLLGSLARCAVPRKGQWTTLHAVPRTVNGCLLALASEGAETAHVRRRGRAVRREASE